MRKFMAVVFSASLVSGCSGEDGGTPTTVPHTSSLVSTGPSHSAPARTGPEVDLTVFGGDSCKTLTLQQLRDNQGGESGTQKPVSGGVECTWSGQGGNSRIAVKLVLDAEGLQTIYDGKEKFPYFEPVTVGPFQAVHFDTIPDIRKGQCSSAVGVGTKTAVITTVYLRPDNPEYATPCQVADRVALLVVGNAQAQGGK